LTPKDLQLAAYRLLGHGVIAMMDQGGLNEWTGELRTLKPAIYLVPGVLSWKIVLAILSVWTLATSAGAFWMLLSAGPRWATSLDGFEMFKFGAQFTDDVNTFRTVDFEGCGEALTRLPGMVGILPGSAVGGPASQNLGFVGLSENVASKDILYTLNRSQAHRTRF
jgi:hypothetical protein